MLPWLEARLGRVIQHYILILGIIAASCYADSNLESLSSGEFHRNGCSKGSDLESKEDTATLFQMKMKVNSETSDEPEQLLVQETRVPMQAASHHEIRAIGEAKPAHDGPEQPKQQVQELLGPVEKDDLLSTFLVQAKAAWNRMNRPILEREKPLTERLTPATSLVLLVMLAVCVGVFFPVEKLEMIVSHTPDWLMVLGFLVFSSLMLVANKLTLVILPLPATVLSTQLLFCALILRLTACTGLMQLDACSIKTLLKFLGVPISFSICLYTSLRVLLYSNVETTIMLRSAVPLLTSFTDVCFFDREWPSVASWASLSAILLSSVMYVHLDSAFDLRSYAWGVIWLGAFFFDVSYVKHIMNCVAMSTWTRVYYNNLLAGVVLLIPAAFELSSADALPKDSNLLAAASALISTSILGAGLSFSAFRVRVFLNATGFAVVNHVAKLFTILINFSLWERHATPYGLMALMLGFSAATLYQEAPPKVKLRESAVPRPDQPQQQQQQQLQHQQQQQRQQEQQ